MNRRIVRCDHSIGYTMMRLFRRGAALAALAILAGVLQLDVNAASATDASSPSPSPEPTLPPGAIDPALAELDDPVSDPEPDVSGSEWAIEVAEHVERLRVSYPDQLASAIVVDQEAEVARVSFLDTIPIDVPSFAGVEYVGGAGFTEVEAHAVVDDLLSELESTLAPTGTLYGVQYLEAEARIDVVVGSAGANATARFSPELVAESAVAATTVPSGLTASVTVSAGLEDGNEAMDAGALLRYPYSPYAPACSSAFPVTRQGMQGVLSAAHCGASVHYWKAGWDIFAYTPDWEVWRYTRPATGGGPGGGDVRWYWSNTAFSNRTYIGSSYRTFTFTTVPLVGTTVCRFGHATGYGCAAVQSTNSAPPSYIGDGASMPVGPMMCTAWVTSEGDSGGPWFNGYSAVGVHASGTQAFGSCFTPIRSALSGLGLALYS